MDGLMTEQEYKKTEFKVNIGKIHFRENWNYKSITRASIDRLKESLMEDGQLKPILVNAMTDNIIGGHHMYIALKELVEENKWNEDNIWVKPVMVKNHKHEKVLALKDNAQYDIATKEEVGEWGAELIDGDVSLINVPVITDYSDKTLLDVIDDLSPSEGDIQTDDEHNNFKVKEIECPSCHFKFHL